MPASCTAAQLNTLLAALAATQDNDPAHIGTPIRLVPKMVGYDTANNRSQWETDYNAGGWGLGEMSTYIEWHMVALGLQAGSATARRTVRLGYFSTETEGWVGKPAGNWLDQEWHAWAAALFPHPSGTGKTLVIYDSNVELAASSYANGYPELLNDLEPKQRALLTLLRQGRGVAVQEVWYGGKGNIQAGICMELTYDWVKQVVDGQGIPGGLSSAALSAAGFWLLRNEPGKRGSGGSGGRAAQKKNKDDGGNGAGGKKAAEGGQLRRSSRRGGLSSGIGGAAV